MTDPGLVERLRAATACPVLADEPLAGYTTLRVGGPATALVRAETCEDLAGVATVCAETGAGWLVVGKGSNLLVADRGWDGVAITLGRGFRGVTVDADRVAAGAAEPMPALARTVAGHHLGGLAFGVAIPGTLGGAVRMNAGAHGHELSQVLAWADVVRLGDGARRQRLSTADLAMGYRHTALPADAVVVGAGLSLRRANPAALATDMAHMRRWRREHQPINEPSCGSVFRNPPGDSAGRLIEAARVKGLRVGGARISPVHANFITAERGTKAQDVYDLIQAAATAVSERCGVALRTEVVVVGFDRQAPGDEAS